MEKEKQILHYMKSLEISREEAEQLWEDDQEDYIGEEGERMTAQAKQMRRYEQAEEKKERKPREKKIDAEKVAVIDFIWGCMLNNTHIMELEDITVANVQKEITFRIGENEYSLTLTKHRSPKKQGGGKCGCRLAVWHMTFNHENMGSNPISRTQFLIFETSFPFPTK